MLPIYGDVCIPACIKLTGMVKQLSAVIRSPYKPSRMSLFDPLASVLPCAWTTLLNAPRNTDPDVVGRRVSMQSAVV